MIKKLGILLFLLGVGRVLFAQDSLMNVPVIWKGGENDEIRSLTQQTSHFPKDTAKISQSFRNLSQAMRSKGYPAFRYALDSSRQDTFIVYLKSGPKYVLSDLQLLDLPEKVNSLSLKKWVRSHPPLNWELLDGKLEPLLVNFPNWGYPFARLDREKVDYRLRDSSVMEVALTYRFHPGPLVHISALEFLGDFQEKNQFIQAIGRVFPGDLYQQHRIIQFSRLLRNSRYFDDVGPPQIAFPEPDQAVVSLEVKPSKRGRFDAVLGVLPPSESNEKLLFTGLVQLALISPLGMGEYFFVDYKSLRAGSQQLEIDLELPYLFRLPFGIKGNLEMLKQSTDFLNVQGEASLVYFLRPNLQVELDLSQRSSRLLELDETLTDSSNTLLQADGNRNSVGLGIHFENLDFPINTTKGISFSLEGNTGTRELRQNRLIPEGKYQNLPETQNSRAIKWELKAFYPIGRRQVIHAAFSGFHLDQEVFFQNDQVLLGGSQNLRGFNENAFFTDSYQQFTVEYRFLLERESNLFIFGDYASLRDKVQRSDAGRIHPLGLGLGMSYGTAAGILSISYGIGRASEVSIPFEPSRGKIHIGLINRF